MLACYWILLLVHPYMIYVFGACLYFCVLGAQLLFHSQHHLYNLKIFSLAIIFYYLFRMSLFFWKRQTIYQKPHHNILMVTPSSSSFTGQTQPPKRFTGKTSQTWGITKRSKFNRFKNLNFWPETHVGIKPIRLG